jgi:hypothetical protein
MLELSETYKDIIFIKVDIQKCEDIEDINNKVSNLSANTANAAINDTDDDSSDNDSQSTIEAETCFELDNDIEESIKYIFQKMSSAITGTVNSAFRIGEAAVQTGEAAVKTAKGVVETAQATTEAAKEGVTIVKKVGENVNVGLEESKKVVETSINALNKQLVNVNENTIIVL